MTYNTLTENQSKTIKKILPKTTKAVQTKCSVATSKITKSTTIGNKKYSITELKLIKIVSIIKKEIEAKFRIFEKTFKFKHNFKAKEREIFSLIA